MKSAYHMIIKDATIVVSCDLGADVSLHMHRYCDEINLAIATTLWMDFYKILKKMQKLL